MNCGALAAVVAGVTLGFLPWNFHPAKIFMGDSGSLLLGLLLAVSTISGVQGSGRLTIPAFHSLAFRAGIEMSNI